MRAKLRDPDQLAPKLSLPQRSDGSAGAGAAREVAIGLDCGHDESFCEFRADRRLGPTSVTAVPSPAILADRRTG
jgi:hypothetical protein